jgi:hypothetical protein|tara:strand:+ start:1549 stop:2115 length:567 start_codon:yes stop_codon:yes gene_type:complete
MVGKIKKIYTNILRRIEMLTKEVLKDNFIDAYFIDEDRKNIEVLTKSEDGKKVIPTIIPFDKPDETGTYPMGDGMEALKSVMSVDELHERTYNKKKEERKLFEEQVMRIAKKDGMVIGEESKPEDLFPSVVKAITENLTNEDHLFALKLALFEVDKIRDSENADLKTSMRQGKDKVEVLINALKIIAE